MTSKKLAKQHKLPRSLIVGLCVLGVAIIIGVVIDRFVFVAQPNVNYSEQYNDYNLDSLYAVSADEIREALNGSKTHPYERMNSLSMDPVDISGKVDWQWHFKEDRSDNFQLHSWDMLDRYIREYETSKGVESLRTLVRVAIDWIDNNPSSLVNNQKKNFAWYDMAVGVRIYRLAYILDQSARTSLVSDVDLKKMFISVADHLAYLKNDENIIFHNNHGLFEAAGQKAATRRLHPINGDIFSVIEKQADSRLNRMVDEQFTTEGIHKEHSPDYHRMVYEVLLSLKRNDLLNVDKDFLAKIGDGLYWMIKPDGYILDFGDSERRLMANDSQLANDTNSSLLKLSLTRKTGELPQVAPFKVFKDAGFAVFKTSDSYLSQQAAFHSRTHKHADDLTFSWYDQGQNIIIDAGKYGYLGKTVSGSKESLDGFWYSDPKRQYVEKTRAHNTVEIDGLDYERLDRKPFGSAIKSSGVSNGMYYIETEVTQFDTIKQNRILFYMPNEWLLVVDRLADSKKENHTYRQWFHLAPDFFAIKSNNSSYRANSEDVSLRITDMTTNGVALDPIRGQNSPLQGWYSPENGVLSPNSALAFELHSTNATFSTLLSLGDGTPAGVLSNITDAEGVLQWKLNGKTNKINFNYLSNKELEVKYQRF